MKYLLTILFIIGASTLYAVAQKAFQKTSIDPTQTIQSAQLSYEVDGDTVRVKINGQLEYVRLIGINAPEKADCYGKEATDYLTALIGDNPITLQADSSQADRDKYGRLLRYIFIGDRNLNEQMIQDGFAREYTYSKPYKYQKAFRADEAKAQQQRLGMWTENTCK